MLKKPLILLGLLLCLFGCARDPAPNLPYLAPDQIILAFGDSLTYGTGAKAEQAYPVVLQEIIRRRVRRVATPGDRTADALAKLPAALDETQPALLILCIGGNDFLRKVPVDITRRNLHALLDHAEQRKVPVLLLGVPRPGLFGLSGAELFEEIATQRDILLDNDSVASILEDKALKADPIHPNAAGYRRLAERIAEALQRAGALADPA